MTASLDDIHEALQQIDRSIYEQTTALGTANAIEYCFQLHMQRRAMRGKELHSPEIRTLDRKIAILESQIESSLGLTHPAGVE